MPVRARLFSEEGGSGNRNIPGMISLLTRRYIYRGDRKRWEKREKGGGGGRVCNCSTRKRERDGPRDGETKRPRGGGGGGGGWEVEREPPKARISISYIIKYRPGGASQRELTSALIC